MGKVHGSLARAGKAILNPKNLATRKGKTFGHFKANRNSGRERTSEKKRQCQAGFVPPDPTVALEQSIRSRVIGRRKTLQHRLLGPHADLDVMASDFHNAVAQLCSLRPLACEDSDFSRKWDDIGFLTGRSTDAPQQKVEKQEKKKTPKGRAKKRLTYTRRFVNVTLTGGKRKMNPNPTA
ncbi:uncharacterized protein SPSK_03496 [Sporothrix schenckii 1099-18]|uniref:Uncharacterized protein n=1 Tax=Sporothrix schenckii 1099-18 TaxID=1397361 RepID=A0A0F2M3E5_SPOSC|nr:uncharacterized protein SPSK_03496 [Sporothrix schenckii 1099-18]KJR82661.1 hypothetical protein SPSK_03496 [Sporothrix schenckii 1099-18]